MGGWDFGGAAFGMGQEMRGYVPGRGTRGREGGGPVKGALPHHLAHARAKGDWGKGGMGQQREWQTVRLLSSGNIQGIGIDSIEGGENIEGSEMLIHVFTCTARSYPWSGSAANATCCCPKKISYSASAAAMIKCAR